MKNTGMFRDGKGYSLTEALVVIVLVGMITAVAIPMMARFLQAYRIQTATQQIAINLRFARNAAVKQKTIYRITFSGNTYQVDFRNTKNVFEPYAYADVSLPSQITIVSGGLTQVDFDARGAATLTPANSFITLKGTDLSEYKITVTLAGAVTLVKTVEGIY